MASTSNIEWTEQTWNPTTGCNKVSPGCKFCYAEIMARRLKAMGAPGYKNGFELTLMRSRLRQPQCRKKPTLYFVNSMSDLFHPDVPVDYLDEVFDVIRSTPHHTYQILTKRAARMREYFESRIVPENAWLGVSAEDKKYGIPRVKELKKIKASTRFISAEPLLEDLGDLNLSNIHWIIVGGESGSNARPMKQEWADRLRKQAKKYGAAYFFKQWGTWGADGVKRTKHANGRELRGKIYNAYPELLSSA